MISILLKKLSIERKPVESQPSRSVSHPDPCCSLPSWRLQVPDVQQKLFCLSFWLLFKPQFGHFLVWFLCFKCSWSLTPETGNLCGGVLGVFLWLLCMVFSDHSCDFAYTQAMCDHCAFRHLGHGKLVWSSGSPDFSHLGRRL